MRKVNSLSQPVLARLMDLDELVAALHKRAESAEGRREHARGLLNGQIRVPGPPGTKLDMAKARAEFDVLYAQAKDARTTATTEAQLLSTSKAWIEALPLNTKLSPCWIDVNGAELPATRARLEAARTRLQALRALPVPSDDIEARVGKYVNELSRSALPIVRGVGAGQQLDIRWPGEANANRGNLSGFSGEFANALLMSAMLSPRHLADLIVRAIRTEAASVCAPEFRPGEIDKLELEVDQLIRLDVVLCDRDGLAHLAGTPPPALLKVREKAAPDD